MQLKRKWCLTRSISIPIVILTNNIDLVIIMVDRHDFAVTDKPGIWNFTRLASSNNSLPIIISKYRIEYRAWIYLKWTCTDNDLYSIRVLSRRNKHRPWTGLVDRQCAIPARICRPGNRLAALRGRDGRARAGRNDDLQVGRASMACTALTNPSGNASCADVPPFARIASATDVRSAVFVKYSAIRSYLHSRLQSLQPPMHRTQPAEIFHYQRW